MQLGLDMADWVDQSFVKAHFQQMTMEYSSWLVNKIADKEVDMASVRKIFLKNNQEKHEANNYEFKRGDKDDKVATADGTKEQPKKRRLKKKCSSYFLALNMFILKVDVKLLGLGII